MKHYIKTYCGEIFAACMIVAVCLMIAPFVFNLQNATGAALLDAGGLCMLVGVCLCIVADNTTTDTDNDTKPDKSEAAL